MALAPVSASKLLRASLGRTGVDMAMVPAAFDKPAHHIFRPCGQVPTKPSSIFRSSFIVSKRSGQGTADGVQPTCSTPRQKGDTALDLGRGSLGGWVEPGGIGIRLASHVQRVVRGGTLPGTHAAVLAGHRDIRVLRFPAGSSDFLRPRPCHRFQRSLFVPDCLDHDFLRKSG